MLPAIAAMIIASSPADRLAAFIVKRNRKAASYAPLLARRILVEAKRHQLKAHQFAAVAWIESDFDRLCSGRHGEHGVWQLRPWDHGMSDGWALLQKHPSEFPIVKRWLGMPWSRMRRRRRDVLRDIRASTYLAGMSIVRHVSMCRRLGHRVGLFRCRSAFINQCQKWHRYEMDRIAHYNSGISWPRSAYLRKLRGRSRVIKRILEGKR